MRKATYQSLTEGETAFVNSFGFETTSELPDLPRSLLPGLFARLSTADIKLALRQKLVPVMCLPHVTLYGSVGEQARVAGEAMGFWIVANILAADYRATVKGSLGPALLRQATSGLKRSQPVFSASRRLTDEQGAFTLAITSGIAACLLVFPLQYFYLAASLFSGLFFLAIIALRLFSILGQSPRPLSVPITQSDEDLPVYSVLVPVFREIGVLDQLVDALSELQYPVEKLDIKLILEETDNKMLHAVAQKNLPPHFEVIVVPAGKLQTKPRALNYALQFARGSLLTIYDAEDIPEPLQLRKAAARFQVAPPYLACLQAELAFYNPDENWLTRGIRAQMPQGIHCF